DPVAGRRRRQARAALRLSGLLDRRFQQDGLQARPPAARILRPGGVDGAAHGLGSVRPVERHDAPPVRADKVPKASVLLRVTLLKALRWRETEGRQARTRVWEVGCTAIGIGLCGQ